MGHRGNITYTHTKRIKHINKSVAIVGIIGFPMPLRVPPIISFMPQIKYVLEIIVIFCLENAITSGVVDIKDDNSPEKKAERNPKPAPKAMVIIVELTMVFFALARLPAPIF